MSDDPQETFGAAKRGDGVALAAEVVSIPESSPELDFQRLYERHGPAVFRLAMRYSSGRAAWAEDVTQDAFVRLLDSMDRLDTATDLGGWLYRVTTNLCVSRLRRERLSRLPPIRWLLELVSDPPRDPEAIASARHGLDQVFLVLDRLSPKERAAFSMFHLDGLGVVEIARNLGHSKGYVSKLLARADAKVKEAFDG